MLLILYLFRKISFVGKIMKNREPHKILKVSIESNSTVSLQEARTVCRGLAFIDIYNFSSWKKNKIYYNFTCAFLVDQAILLCSIAGIATTVVRAFTIFASPIWTTHVRFHDAFVQVWDFDHFRWKISNDEVLKNNLIPVQCFPSDVRM